MSRLESMIATDFLTGELTETKGEVSEKFLKGAKQAIDIYRGWGLKTNVDLSGFTPVKHTEQGKRVGMFFTLGVDSFYTLLTHSNEIDDLIYIKGFELKLNQDVYRRISENIRLVARILDKNPIFWESNIRKKIDKHVHWYTFGHGPALVSEALAREGAYKKIYIPATLSPRFPGKCASHQDIDPLWSTETLEFVHDGPLTRLEKLKYISNYAIAMDMLRVCYQGTAYNCGTCSKCIRTMVSLNLLGVFSGAFGMGPSLQLINKLAKEERKKENWNIWQQNIEEAERLIKALKGEL